MSVFENQGVIHRDFNKHSGTMHEIYLSLIIHYNLCVFDHSSSVHFNCSFNFNWIK